MATASLVAISVQRDPLESLTDDAANRRQVLTVLNGRVTDIRGFETREEAVTRLV